MKEGVLSLEGTVTRFEGEIDSETARFSQIILDSISPLNRNAQMLLEKLDHPKLSTIKTPMNEALSFLQAQEDSLNQIVEESKMLAMFQTQLKQSVSEFSEINEVAAHFELKMKLWSGLDTWQKLAVSYSDTIFDDIDVAAISKQVQMYVKVAYQAQKQLPGNEAADLLQRSGEIQARPPRGDRFTLVVAKNRHWDQIHAALGFQMKGESSMTLGGLIKRNVMKHGETISAVAVSAQQAVLEEMLKKVTDAWATTEFEVKPYKESRMCSCWAVWRRSLRSWMTRS
ncbi:Dynein heavy chain [Phytophthora infestans]|uniref:Dynein heavy chain n=1 Tax=Phytophthora infestans TaxID=4787 RepID=A0A833SH08_PHYIN|nr:Dynein heavy chain [Phytophthora infestans]